MYLALALHIHLRYMVPATRKIIGADASMPQRKKKKRESVEGTTYNHGRPEGISEDQHPMNQFLGMLRAGPPIRTQIYGIIPRGSSLPTSPDPAP